MTGRLTLISHASTSAVRAAAFALDEPLDPAGQAKAAALAAGLRKADRAWTSPALRARQTAAALGLDAAIEPALRDIDVGRWAGHRLAAIEATEPDAVAAWTSEPGAAPHGGESVVALLDRIAPWLEERRHDAGHGVAVTHAAIIRAAIVLAIGAQPDSFWRIDVAPLGRVELRGDGKRWILRSITN